MYNFIYEKDSQGNEVVRPEKLYQAIHNAIDVFIEVYKHCQSLEGIYQFYKNDRNDPRLIPRVIGNRAYTPIDYRGLIALARLTKQPDYESLKKEYIKKDLAWCKTKYDVKKRDHDAQQERIYQRKEGNYEKEPYRAYNEERVTKVLNDFITQVEALDVDELLAMDLPKAMDI